MGGHQFSGAAAAGNLIVFAPCVADVVGTIRVAPPPPPSPPRAPPHLPPHAPPHLPPPSLPPPSPP
eukprot:5972772-Prymnesium_polylepis.1